MSEGLSRREVLVAGAAFLAAPACTSKGLTDSGLDTDVKDRREMLIDALLGEDIDTLVDASEAELAELRTDPDLKAVVPDCHHILYTAGWWGYFKRQAVAGNRPFVLPQVVRDNLHWKAPVDKDPLATTYGIC